MTTPIRVLLADDQDLVRVGLRIILESEDGIEVVGEARNGREAVALGLELAPDVICMDVQMPELDGLEATRQLIAHGTAAGILILTTFDRDDYLFAALEAGASGFVLKNSSPESLVDAVQVVARGDALLSPDVTRRVIESFARRRGAPTPAPAGAGHAARTGETKPAEETATTPTLTPAPELDALTDREREVLGLLAAGRSNAEIARELYLGEATVKTHVSKILQKLGLRDRIQAVVFAYETGVAVPGRP
ncbi:response regulator [Herbiconiux flava]|uniref:DNA-binding NarL/FixJ family response regulator n=1 Tax=Herbiconiux flava TaxID=881268 RepID=A0A852SJH6_9MICO|nr:response regulator transcription factor [Herbiconiux flava]NYD69503.1 DNA-binding NarL/FixJ family response regulator [Herbiconiux flava]GLK16248.1 DNA-binding response regulator [Herbiconiux flava]